MSQTKINIKRTSDYTFNIRDRLNSLMTKIRSNEIIIKHAYKGSIVGFKTRILLDNVLIAFK